ncbi:MAG: ribosome maturation factor RimM [bacterium]
MRYVSIARVQVPHGVKGWLNLRVLTDNLEHFRPGSEVFIGEEGAPPEARVIEDARISPKACRVLLKGLRSREEAAKVRGLCVYVPEARLPPIREKDTFYSFQIIGMRVRDDTGREWGTVTNIFSAGGNDVYVVTGEKGREYYVPALRAAVKKVDTRAGAMEIDPEWAV